ncbi:hypothetical protein [Streptomyces sp. NBC_01618]|uniref:hypothetical protein n=1 Tax=Streptomyces sp. NBC_01618 TaxID=2975900 RepID=UPI0038693B48
MHADEPDIGESLVRRLIASQFPDWAGLPVEPVILVGTSNAMYRLGEDLVVRLPRTAGTAGDVDKEQRRLPRSPRRRRIRVVSTALRVGRGG